MIIDTHVHLVDKNRNFERAKRKLIEELKKNNVDYAIVIPDSLSNTECADTKVVLKLIESEDNLFALGAYNPINPSISLKELEELIKQKLILGVKLYPGFEPFYPNDLRLSALQEICSKYNVPVVFHTGYEHKKYSDPKFIVKIVEKFPKLKIVIAHLFVPKIDYCLKLTESFENIYYDLSALSDFEEEIKDKLSLLKSYIEQYNSRFISGSDYPACSMKEALEFVFSLDLDKKVLRKILFENAKRIYKLRRQDFKK